MRHQLMLTGGQAGTPLGIRVTTTHTWNIFGISHLWLHSQMVCSEKGKNEDSSQNCYKHGAWKHCHHLLTKCLVFVRHLFGPVMSVTFVLWGHFCHPDSRVLCSLKWRHFLYRRTWGCRSGGRSHSWTPQAVDSSSDHDSLALSFSLSGPCPAWTAPPQTPTPLFPSRLCSRAPSPPGPPCSSPLKLRLCSQPPPCSAFFPLYKHPLVNQ